MLSIMLTYWAYAVMGSKINNYCGFKTTSSTDRNTWVLPGCTSNLEKVTSGVPQGSIFGPFFFALLINDIHLTLNSSNVLLYADDTVIYYANKSASDVERVLNTEVGYIAKWFDKKNLILNLKKGKTEFVLYRSSKKLSTQADISIKINNITTYKYLGVSLDNQLSVQNYVSTGFVQKSLSTRKNVILYS